MAFTIIDARGPVVSTRISGAHDNEISSGGLMAYKLRPLLEAKPSTYRPSLD